MSGKLSAAELREMAIRAGLPAGILLIDEQDADGDIDSAWREVAEFTRQAAALLGYPITSPCLPHEAKPCGAGYGMHAAAHLGVIQAVADHQLEHLGMTEVAQDVYEHTRAELAHRDQVSETGGTA